MAYQNFFAAKLYTDIGAADTTITLDTAPTATSGRMVLEARNPTQREIIKYTGVSGTQLTGVTRGQGGTTAKSHLKNALVEMNATAEDLQDLYDAFTSFSSSTNDWRTVVPSVVSVTHNGNRSYDVLFTSPISSFISNGMRLRTTRTVAAPTQCTSLNGTTQYWVKTSPNKMTFTDDFVVSAWVKLSSYATSNIVSRINGTQGWALGVTSDGRVGLRGYNASLANESNVVSYQSLPLNRWVHVTAQLDMSAFTATTTTSYVMIDGVDVPVAVSRGGTNPTALVQAGNLEIGSKNGGTEPFPGKIAQVAVFNSKVTQATMRGYMAQGLTGSEPSLASAYSFNGVVTDLNTTTPNDLSAGAGSPTATNADSPFGGQGDGTISSTLDYAIVQTVSGSTINVQVPEGCTIPTTGGVSAVSYSSAKAPYGMPVSRDKWRVESIGIAVASSTVALATFIKPANLQLTVPVGSWVVTNKQNTLYTFSSAGAIQALTTVSTSTSAETDKRFSSLVASANVSQQSASSELTAPVSVGTATTYYQISQVMQNTGGGTITIFQSFAGVSGIIAENAYL